MCILFLLNRLLKNFPGLDIVDISIDAVGDYYTFKNDKTNKGVTAIINIGHSKTSFILSKFNCSVFTVLKVHLIPFLGARDFDFRIYDYW